MLRPACLLLVAAALVAPAALAPAAEAPDAAPAKDLVITTLPGITLDTKAREVRLEGTICLKKGALELFACAEGTREHESIVAVKAKPSHVTFALAMLGLKSGQPGYLTEGGAFSPPAGEVLDVACRYKTKAGETRTLDAYKLLRLTGGDVAVDRPIEWVYVGRTEADALRAADREGTVLCLSNFPEAVIDVPFESTSANSDLVYEANPKTVPEPGTPVELVLKPTGRRIEPKKVEVEIVLKKGQPPELDGKPMDFDTLAATVRSLPAAIRTTVLRVDPEEPFGRVMKVHGMLRDALMEVHLALLEPRPSGPVPGAAPPLAVAVTADDTVRVGDKTMPAETFAAKAAEVLGEATRVELTAEKGASAATVAQVMAAIRDAGAGVTLQRAGDGAAP